MVQSPGTVKTDIVLETFRLTKTYGGKTVVDGVQMSVRRGEIYGFLGQNGSGKTTTLRIILGLVRPTFGEVMLFGEKLNARNHHLLERVGAVLEYPNFYPNLTAEENLVFHCRMMGVDGSRIDEVLARVGLMAEKKRKVEQFSFGMKQRLCFARAMLHQPELIILDEPTNGLDAVGIRTIRELILELAHQRNVAFLITSHILSEVQQWATKVGIIHRGRLLEEVDAKTLKEQSRRTVEVTVNDDRRAAVLLEQRLGIVDYIVRAPGVIWICDPSAQPAPIARALIEHGLDVHSLAVKHEALEDYFMRLIDAADEVERTHPAHA